MRCINVVIADRHPIVLQGLSRLLGADGDFNIVASLQRWCKLHRGAAEFRAGHRNSRRLNSWRDRVGNSLPHQFRKSFHATGLFHRN